MLVLEVTPMTNDIHYIVAKAIKSGELVKPDRCGECNNEASRILAHHDDNTKPLDVRWLCPSCHSIYHRKKWLEDFIPKRNPIYFSRY